ncbi:hypothetical protein EHQ86_00290 [Leptospira yasudae]|nr:hypothetical protein EHQ86_00290 [Leptospira yasudae]
MTEIQNKKHQWFQINEEGLKGFKTILRSLIAFEKIIKKPSKSNSENWNFKIRFVNSINSLVTLKKFGEYEYLVFAKNLDPGKVEYSSWIHIDGIQMERLEFERSGILNHDVFDILNMTDIYTNYCEPYTGEIPEDV